MIVPEEIRQWTTAVESSFGHRVGPESTDQTNCAVLSFRDDLFVNFASVIESRELERLFFTHMARAGMRVILAERSSDP